MRRRVSGALVAVALLGCPMVVGTPTAAAYRQSDVDCAFAPAEFTCTDADLSYYYGFSERVLAPGKNLSGSTVTGSEFIRASAVGVNLSGATLFRANFGGAVLTGANLSNNSGAPMSMGGADLAGARLEKSYLVSTTAAGANLSGATLSHADLTRSTLADADLTGANLTGATLWRAYVAGADFSNVVGLTREQFDVAGTFGTPAVYPPSAGS